MDKAVEKCRNTGFIPLVSDLYHGTGEDYVILGYKTTDVKEDAITDLSVLQMGSGNVGGLRLYQR